MKIQLRFLLLLILINAGVALLFFQAETLRLMKENEFQTRQDEETLRSWNALPLLFQRLVSLENKQIVWNQEEQTTSSLGFWQLKKDGAWYLWVRNKPSDDGPQEMYTTIRLGETEKDLIRDIMRIPELYESIETENSPLNNHVLLPLNGPISESASETLSVRVSGRSESSRNLGLANLKLLGLILSLSTVLVTLLIYFWFIRPLLMINTAFRSGKLMHLSPLLGRSGEVADLAELTRQFFQQKDELEREIRRRDAAEACLRARENQLSHLLDQQENLMRDLHDEVIQTLFALGLRMEAALPTSMDKESCRNELNRIIHKIRGYLESPSAPLGKSFLFAQAIHDLTERLGQPNPCIFDIIIPEEVEEQISSHQAGELLALMTEALSNSLRHGKARKIEINASCQSDGHIRIEIHDDGKGCDLNRITMGHGLANIRSRARDLNAEVTFHSEPEKGFHIVLKLINYEK